MIDEIIDNKLLDKALEHNFRIEEIILAGHSFGGCSAITTKSLLRKMLPKTDKKLELFKKIVCLDPWLFPLTDELYDSLEDENILIINS